MKLQKDTKWMVVTSVVVFLVIPILFLAWFPTAPPSSVASGVTNGDSHDHSGGDGAQIDHTGLSNIGTNTHAQVDSHIANTSNPHTVTAAQLGALQNVVEDTTPQLGGPLDMNGQKGTDATGVDDDDCAGDQGKYWWDSTDNQWEFCNANSGTPIVVGSGGGLTNPVTSDGATTVENQVPQFTATNNQLKDSLGVTTTVGDPGADTDLVTAQGIREALEVIDADSDGKPEALDLGSHGIVEVAADGTVSVADFLKLAQKTAEPTDETVGDIVFADIQNWDPASVGGSNDYFAICTDAGAPGTWVALFDVSGTLLVSSIILENSANPTNTTEARIQWDSDDDMIVVGDNAAAAVVGKKETCLPPVILAEPDQLQTETDDWPLYHFPAEHYPGGFTVTAIHIGSSATDTGTLDFREYTNNGTAWTNASQIESITLSGIYTEDDGTLADSAIAADSGIWVSFGGSGANIAFYQVQVCGTINTFD